MGKAIAILNEMPPTCYDCQFQYWSTLFGIYCQINNRLICEPEEEINKKNRADWCPLKELPERKDTVSINLLRQEAKENHVKPEAMAGFNIGWNQCLNTIEGMED